MALFHMAKLRVRILNFGGCLMGLTTLTKHFELSVLYQIDSLNFKVV